MFAKERCAQDTVERRAIQFDVIDLCAEIQRSADVAQLAGLAGVACHTALDYVDLGAGVSTNFSCLPSTTSVTSGPLPSY